MFEERPKLGETSEKLNEVREFEFENGVRLVFRLLDGEPSLRFIDREGKDSIVLDEFAPAGTVFRIGDAWSANVEEGLPVLTIEKVEGAGAIMDFLHEAGHLNDPEGMALVRNTRRLHQEEVEKDASKNSYPKSRFIALKNKKEAVMKSERYAWSYALRRVRNIEKKLGINIFDKLGGEGTIAEKAKQYIDRCLTLYEDSYIQELYDDEVYTKEQMEKFFAGLEEEKVA